jgi:hypothetical protein
LIAGHFAFVSRAFGRERLRIGSGRSASRRSIRSSQERWKAHSQPPTPYCIKPIGGDAADRFVIFVTQMIAGELVRKLVQQQFLDLDAVRFQIKPFAAQPPDVER